ncbi:MAG: hypothetical protein ABIG37_00160 [Nanoarchaeota archaeon]|nr:hypothetical protein [Nanoarchaeota archaeon]
MGSMSKLEKTLFEIVNVAGDVSIATGIGLLVTGNESGAFYFVAGVCGEIISTAHENLMNYERSDMPFWSKIKYSFIPPFKYIGRTDSESTRMN